MPASGVSPRASASAARRLASSARRIRAVAGIDFDKEVQGAQLLEPLGIGQDAQEPELAVGLKVIAP